MKIGILGTRGIPNAYGGFEQFAEYLSTGLVKRGHEVWVYNSTNHPYKESQWNGINIIHSRDLEHKMGTAGQFIYDYNCIKDARKRNFDVLLQLGYTSNSVWFFIWPDTVNMVNMDGLEWKRTKYNSVTRRFLKFAERLAARHADQLVADSPGIQQYLATEYKKDAVYIPYGAEDVMNTDAGFLTPYQLLPHRYFLVIARMEPENNIELIIKGYIASDHAFPLVLVGNPNNRYGRYLQKNYAQDNIRFIGPVYDTGTINSLRGFSHLYFHGHSVGGTNPSLLEAMGNRCVIAAHDNVFNSAILTDCADYFSREEDVSRIINQERNQEETEERKRKNTEKIRTLYNWEKIINAYEKLFLDSITRRKTNNRQKPL